LRFQLRTEDPGSSALKGLPPRSPHVKLADMQADPNLYDDWPYQNRPRITWPGGKKLAFWIAPNIEFYEFEPPVNRERPGWPRPTPDVVAYSQRDWGNRVGHWRLMELMDRYDLKGSVSLNVAMCDHCPEIIEACAQRGWEFFSHGIYNTRYSYDMSEAQERAVLEDSIKTVQDATGQRIRGYLAPALTHTERTLDLIAEYDFWYTCDLFQDDQPQPVKTRTGQLMSMPYSLEVNDVITYGALAMSAERYADILVRHFDQLLEEGEESGTVMCIPLHAYLVGQPHRLKAFERALAHICSHRDDVWFTRAVDIAGFYRDNCWDNTLADIQARGLATGGSGFRA
jgi:allantoinase